ncbi:hypothetical protein jhhlp_000161 [Lomentospora prolificans]|uniref:CENP-V/GFA domain-containing protein n=1 Tax=Lomentospora prolificans TaxID=41688 RepID=A0A2N3NLS4_9PEZI|nr:hypothetical protein jhhlp_000161 [Lomentospora prolificans]
MLRTKASDIEGSAAWEISTGVIKAATGEDEGRLQNAVFKKHMNVADTKDGGASVWLPQVNGRPLHIEEGGDTTETSVSGQQDAVLPGSCDCGNVSFQITRPNAQSYAPKSGWPDLTHAYHSITGEQRGNPGDAKWWIRENGTKYLAGTCACRSCRLMSGFEIQVWAFVPRTNIYFRAGGVEVRALDFATLPAGTIKPYESSAGVLREFCPGCGATIFWHDKWRPDVIDVSVGLLDAPEGARAERWLDWWTQRISFVEDSGLARTGAPARHAQELASALESGLKAWKQQEQ